MNKPHKHAEIIKAWADGAEVEFYDKRFNEHRWKLCGDHPLWDESVQYRIKTEPKPDIVLFRRIDLNIQPSVEMPNGILSVGCFDNCNVQLTFDGDTRKLKSLEML